MEIAILIWILGALCSSAALGMRDGKKGDCRPVKALLTCALWPVVVFTILLYKVYED